MEYFDCLGALCVYISIYIFIRLNFQEQKIVHKIFPFNEHSRPHETHT